MEYVDVVDAQDNVLYSVPKTEAHEKGLLHRTVIAEVRDTQGRYVLVRQAADRQDPGQYVSPVGGHVRTAESNDDAMKREAMEEIGIEGFEYHPKGKFIFNRFVKGRQENHFFIVYEITNAGKLKLGSESVSYKAFTKEELKMELSSNRKDFGIGYIRIVENFYPELLE